MKVQPENFLCGHEIKNGRIQSFRMTCPTCHSYWDLQSLERLHKSAQYQAQYPENYPQQRKHFDSDTGANKVLTLASWIKKINLQLQEKTVCEVGFGVGYTLKYISNLASHTFGIEAVQSNINFATNELGLPRDHLFFSTNLPGKLSILVDLWIFQDSFEHILDIDEFLRWMTNQSQINSEVFIVAPRADSLSQKIMGKLWIHKGEDHVFHWSLEGITNVLNKNGYVLEKSFYPLKRISFKTVAYHILAKTGKPTQTCLHKLVDKLSFFSMPFNFGEMGLLFKRRGGTP